MDSGQSDDQNIAYRIWVGTIVTIVPATFAVVLRFLGRHVSRAGFWWDDYTIAIALVFNWAMAILRWVQVIYWGFGRHAAFLSEEDVRSYQKSFLGVQILYFTNAVFTKSSLLLLYQRIFGVVSWFRWVLRFTGFLVTAYWIACSIVAIWGCSPISYFWNMKQPGSCINETNFFRWNGIANIILDFLVLCVPFPMLWYLKTSLRQKLVLSGIFLLGGFVCVTSIVRVIAFDRQNSFDPTYTTVDTAAWSSIEQSVGILCACLPTMRPFFRRLYGDSGKQSDQTSQTLRTASPQSGGGPATTTDRGMTQLGHLDLDRIETLPSGLENQLTETFSKGTSVGEEERQSCYPDDMDADEEQALRQTHTGNR